MNVSSKGYFRGISEVFPRVHYGSDVEVTTYGSGFPSTDLDKYSGWNLNKFATFPGSLLKFLNEQVSGVTIPMM